jgi:hypothetical protein
MGHQFDLNLGSVDKNHPDVQCHEGNGTDHCVMDSERRDHEDGYTEFCYDPPNHIDEVRDATDGL